ncbi:40S ribosomal protein S25 [Malassezia yamatoensis]|uniref:40S ribosomal protein S25 n=1 Tax=Malassezia yamatoensis TaxID=253288 RepID=A0AAJ5YPK7_9BASI|nr:40S ribosomal protein S25 [Malassezia yamatoensis]
MAILEELPGDSNGTQETLIVDESSGEPKVFALDSDGRRVELVDGESELELHDSDSDESVADPTNAQELYEQIQEERMSESLETKLDLVIWCMPFVFLFEIMSILIQQQYGIEITWRNEAKSLASRLPCQTEKRRWLSQSAAFLLGTLCGSCFLYVLHEMPPKKSAIAAAASKAGKKKKWSKGKVKDKAQNAVTLDKALYERVMKEVPTFKMITPSVLIDRLKINGSLARVAIRHFAREGQIKPLIHHHGQLVYTRVGSD